MDERMAYIQSLEVELTSNIDEHLLLMAFTHKSFSMDAPHANIPHNERLEFLGDSLLGMAVAHQLYEQFPTAPESDLTLMKISLVKEPTLASVARQINLHEHVRLGHGEAKSGGGDKDAILSDTLEALLGYLYLDHGRGAVASFVKRYIMPELGNESAQDNKSYKTLLQELVQRLHKTIPVYEDREMTVEPTGNVTEYASDVYVQGEHIATGQGVSKKKAQEHAAAQAYEKLHTIA